MNRTVLMCIKSVELLQEGHCFSPNACVWCTDVLLREKGSVTMSWLNLIPLGMSGNAQNGKNAALWRSNRGAGGIRQRAAWR